MAAQSEKMTVTVPGAKLTILVEPVETPATTSGKVFPPVAGEATGTVEPFAVRADEVAKLLNVSQPKVYELAAREDFQGAFKFGGCTLFSVEALRDWVQRQCETGGD